MRSTFLSAASLAASVFLTQPCVPAQAIRSEPVIVGITLDGKNVLVELNGKKVSATADGVVLPENQIDEKGNLIILKDRQGNVVAQINRWKNGGQIYRIKRSESAAIGIELQPLGKGLADHLELDPAQVIYVARAIEGRAAAKAGLRDHDIILQIDGRKPANEKVLRDVLQTKKPGDEMKVRVVRRGEASDFVIRCERAKTDVASGFNFSYSTRFPSVYNALTRKNYQVSFERALKAIGRAKSATGKSQTKEGLQKQLEKARESLLEAQKTLNMNRVPDPLIYDLLGVRGQTNHFDTSGSQSKKKDNLFFVDSKLNPFFTSRAKPAWPTASTIDLGKKIEKLEKRFDRFERLLKKLLEKKKSKI